MVSFMEENSQVRDQTVEIKIIALLNKAKKHVNNNTEISVV